MPERRQRPLHAIRSGPRANSQQYGEHDNPPASDTVSGRTFVPQSRVQRTHRNTTDGTDSDELTQQSDSATAYVGSQSRRRRRSLSWEEDDDEGGLSNTAYASDSRRARDELRQRLLKRRRFDLDSTPVTYPPKLYGHYGQVEPGRLKMILISCDGGENNDPKRPTMYLGPHNVLRADQSVYSSARSTATMILRHADDTPFSVTQITIVAPEHGFQAPSVRSGRVHVDMSLSAVSVHAERDLTPSPVSMRSAGRLTLQEALRDQEIQRRLRKNPNRIHACEDYDDWLDARWQGEIELLDDAGLVLQDESEQDVIDYRMERMRDAEYRRDGVPGWRGPRHLRRSDDFSLLTHQQQQQALSTAPASQTQESKLQRQRMLALYEDAPCVPFFMSPDKDQVTIRFNTPPSGRFIMLKMISDEPTDSVVVQSVIVMGYAGPRFIPACTPR